MKTKNILIAAVILMTAVQAGCEYQEGPLEGADDKEIVGGKSGGSSTGGATTGGTTTGGAATKEILPGGGTTGGSTTGGTTTGGTTTGGTTTGGTTTGGTTGGGAPAKICAAGVSAGGDHTCARGSDGSLRCWGSNFFGQLGNGLEGLDLEDLNEEGEAVGYHSSIPVEVSTLGSGVSDVAAGNLHHTCVRKTDGSLWCWGYNSFGKLGNGTEEKKLVPFQVSAPSNEWAGITAGTFHTCARKTDGSLWCWGRNHWGQLGNDDNTKANQLAPVQIAPAEAKNWAEVSASAGGHTCARKADGSLWCWGYNFFGQLGDGTEQDKLKPVQVTSASNDWTEVSTGSYHTCARKTDGSLWCWGYNDMGQLGNGTKDKKKEPFQVGMLKDWTEVSAGLAHTCARKTDGSLWCWGRNDVGQLGDDSTMSKKSPVQVGTLGMEVAEVSAGSSHTCARKTDGSLWCWGANASGQLGDGKTENTKKPVQVQYFCQ